LVGKLLLFSEGEIINAWGFPSFSLVENSTTLMMRIDNLERSPLFVVWALLNDGMI
jgi:hypothetical protein